MMNRCARIGGIILCGGESRRMGQPKALLPFGPELMIERVVRILSPLVHPLVVVSAPDQRLPQLNNIRLATDRRAGRGPLEGLAAGLAEIGNDADAAYVTSCDVPLLGPGFVRALISHLQNYSAAVPVENDRYHPLAAVYRTDVLPVVQQLLAEDHLRPTFIFDHVPTKFIPVDELRSVDPELHSLMNLNHREEYLAALKIAGFA